MGESKKIETWLKLAIGIAMIVLINQLMAKFPQRIDLTEEGKYTINDKTKKVLTALEEPLYIEVYLDGELPNSFKRLKKSVEETIVEFEIHSDVAINYQFIDPASATGNKSRNEFYKQLAQKGIQPTNVNYTRNGSKSEKLIFPGAILNYRGKEAVVMLLKGNKLADSETTLNQSIENLEYELATAIKTLIDQEKPVIGLVKGHQEIDSLNLASLTNSLLEKYNVFNVKLNKDPLTIKERYDALLVIQPKQSFTEAERFVLDQYVMNGGHLLLFVDALHTRMDSAGGEGTFAFPYEHGLDDLMYSLGARINDNYLLDLNCSDYPVVVGNMGNQPQLQMLPWPFYPVINNYGSSSITKNLDAVTMKFVSTIDTIASSPAIKEVLLKSSPYTKIASAPVKVSVNDLSRTIDPNLFQKGQQVVGVLLKPPFRSFYKNKLLPPGVSSKGFKAENKGQEGSVLIVSDGDFLANDLHPKTGQPMPLGFDPFKNQTFANTDFVLNVLEYMSDKDGLIQTRLKDLKIRPLDKVKAEEEKFFWQCLNLGLPILLLVVFGLAKFVLRKRKYTRHN